MLLFCACNRWSHDCKRMNISDMARGNSSQRLNKPDIVRLLPHQQSGITKREAMSNMLETCFIYCFKPKHRLKGFFSSRSKAGGYRPHTYDSCHASLMCNRAFRRVGRWNHCNSYLQTGRKCPATAHQYPGEIKTGYSHQPSKQAGNAVAGNRMRQRKENLKGRVSKVEEKQDLLLQLKQWSVFPDYLFLDKDDFQELYWGLEVMLCHRVHGRPSRASSNTAPDSAAHSSKCCQSVHCVHFLLYSFSVYISSSTHSQS